MDFAVEQQQHQQEFNNNVVASEPTATATPPIDNEDDEITTGQSGTAAATAAVIIPAKKSHSITLIEDDSDHPESDVAEQFGPVWENLHRQPRHETTTADAPPTTPVPSASQNHPPPYVGLVSLGYSERVRSPRRTFTAATSSTARNHLQWHHEIRHAAAKSSASTPAEVTVGGTPSKLNPTRKKKRARRTGTRNESGTTTPVPSATIGPK